jgi:NADH-quinone oxidoreductase subunit L
MTHAFFKALLFLGSGSVIHALGGEQDMRKMGGLWRRIPWTFWTFVAGTAAIAGIPFLSGYYSKEEILGAALGEHSTLGTFVFAIGMATAMLTAFYMTRLLVLTFLGSYRGGAETEGHIHESPWSMVVPLVVLAIGSIAAGRVPVPRFVEPAFRVEPRGEAHVQWLPFAAFALAALGIAGALYLFLMYQDLARRLAERLAAPARVLQAKYGFDALYDLFAARVVVGGSEDVLWRGLDTRIIDGAVNGAGALSMAAARGVRAVQSGLVRAYALLILGGAVGVLSYLLWRR